MHTHFLDLPEQGKKCIHIKHILYIQCTYVHTYMYMYVHVHASKVHTCTVVVQKHVDLILLNHWKFTMYCFCSTCTFEIQIKTVKMKGTKVLTLGAGR